MDKGYKRLIQVWHRRCGKDKTDINIVVKEMCKRVGAYYYFFPTYSQGKKILWDGADKNGFPFLGHFPAELIDKKNEQELKIHFKNGSIFQIIGVDNVDSIVGSNPIGCVFSEYSLQNPKAWDYIRPILAENGGWAIFNFTPRGRNHAYDLLEMTKNDPKWWVEILPADKTGILSPEILAQERLEIMTKNGDDSLFQQEYFCSFTASIIGAYYYSQYDKALQGGRITKVPYDESALVHTVWDLGISDAMSVGFWQTAGFERHLIDYLEVVGQGLPQVIKLINEKPYTYGKHFAPHDIRQRELSTGMSRLDAAAKLGIDFEVVPSIGLADGIDMARKFWGRVWVDNDNCQKFLRAIPQYSKEYNEDRRCYNDKPLHDWTSHPADMFRYSSLVADEMTSGANVRTILRHYTDEVNGVI